MVVTDERRTSAVGVLRAGANAVDAAVAVGYALAVLEPCCGNLRGGGFMTLHLADGRDRFVDSSAAWVAILSKRSPEVRSS
jgi:gamma-glutamyltranspeptidase / glutathione hydrolase